MAEPGNHQPSKTMTRGSRENGITRAIAWFLFVCTTVASAAGDNQGSARGRRLFETGIGRDGHPVEAVFADSATPIPGALLSCAGCHGKDGKGRTTKGLNPPDITWQSLTKPYSLRVGVGRSRPPYTEPLVARAITLGRDSGGQLLAVAMPRFRLTHEEAADLLAYLRELGSEADPGVGPEALSIGVILPPRDQEPAVHDESRAVLAAYVEGINRGGGIFGRRVEFSFIDAARNLDSRSALSTPAIEQAVLAAMVISVHEHDLALVAEQQEMPLIALRADKVWSAARNVFYLSAGAVGELGALATQAARQLDPGNSRLAVLYRDGQGGRSLMAALRPIIEPEGWQAIDELRLTSSGEPPEEILRRIGDDDALLVAASDPGLTKILASLGRAGRTPIVLLPGSMTVPEWLPQNLSPQMTILLGFELAGLSPSSTEMREYAALEREHGLDERLPPQRSALAAARLMVEGLRRAGRDVTRAKLIEAIESVQHFATGYLPPLSYGPRKHTGFIGAQIVPFDPQRRQLIEPVGRIELD
jgi:ABC-type branched-subunit amino acid transport system substrate-binding protein